MNNTDCNLSGVITNMGLPVAGTSLQLYDYALKGRRLARQFLTQTRTEQKGSFNFAVCQGIYCLEIIPNSNTRFARQLLTSIDITEDKEINIILKPGYIFSGSVQDYLGQPIVDGEILLVDVQSHNLQLSQAIEQNGQFQIIVLPGKYRLAVRLSDKECVVENNKQNEKSLPFFSWLPDILELSTDCQQLICLPRLVKFSGTVATKDGHFVPGVEVTIIADDAFFATTSNITKEDGSFAFLLCPAVYQICLKPSVESNLAELFIDQIVVDNNKHCDYVLEPGYTLKGKVINNNRVMPGAQIIIHNEIQIPATPQTLLDTRKFVQLSDLNGNFSFSLPADSYKIYVVCNHTDQGGEQTVWHREFILDKHTEMDLCLDETVLVSCNILDPLKRACAQVPFSLYAIDEGMLNPLMKDHPLIVGTTDNDGYCNFYITPGNYWFVLNNQPDAGWKIQINKSEEKKVSLTINHICLVSFEIMSELGKPIPASQISYELYDIDNKNKEDLSESHLPKVENEPTTRSLTVSSISQDMVTTDKNGRCMLALPVGIYSFEIQPPFFSGFESRKIRQLSINNHITRRVRLETLK